MRERGIFPLIVVVGMLVAGGCAPAIAATGDAVTLEGGFTWEYRDGLARVSVGEIRNASGIRVTGELRVALWATYPWWYREGEGGLSGFPLAHFDVLPPLSPGGSHRSLAFEASSTIPLPPGAEMIVALVLMERKPSLCAWNAIPDWCEIHTIASAIRLTVPARTDAVTLYDASSLCIENVSPDLARQVRAAEPALTWHELPPSTRCADLGLPLFAGYLRGSGPYIPSEPGSPGLARVHVFDYLAARQLCQMSVVVECVMGSPAGGTYTDLWWNPNESGWGLSVTHHPSGTAFAVWFTYDAQGAAKWYVAPDCRVFLVGCESKLYETTGPAFGQAFDPSRVRAREVGTLRLSFLGVPSTMSYVVDGQAGTREISRQPF